MQSLIQPEVLDEVNKHLDVDSKKLPSQIQTVLTLALTKENVTNERLRFVLRLHKSDITSLLQYMCRQGWLLSEGYGRGTKYRLPSKVARCNVVSNDPNVDSLGSNVDSPKEDTNTVIGDNALSSEARYLLKKKRLSQTEMENLICEITSEWRTIQDLTQILRKDKTYLRNHVLPNLISNGVLEREYPSIPNHPNQRYRRKQV